jgi:hypothetical protein
MYICPVYGKRGPAVEADLQGRLFVFYPAFSPTYVHPQALQLLEYLIKHGSERVVDDSRSHISTLKMLRNFHYIDDKGKDEGQNGMQLKAEPSDASDVLRI